jgi:hypothetical protein
MNKTIRCAAAGAAAAGCLLLASCSAERGRRLPETGATLEGTVLYGSDKVPFAVILVQGPDATAQGKIGEDGRYKVENVPLGEVTIGVNTNSAKGDYMALSMARSYKGPESQGRARAALPPFVDVPARYAEPETSGVKVTIQPGPNTYDIKLTR